MIYGGSTRRDASLSERKLYQERRMALPPGLRGRTTVGNLVYLLRFPLLVERGTVEQSCRSHV